MVQLGVWRRSSMQSDGMAPLYSIKHEWDGAVALITGGSGYIGSVVLEQLLRTTNVSKVYLLLRPRKGQPIDARLQALLQGPLFHHVRDTAAIINKVCAVGGDISQAGLGLGVEDRAMLLSSLDFIIHCAADIRLEADIQETLTANFEGTRTVLGLAAAAGDHLKALVHVSSAFVNMNQPCSSTIDEQLYPLRYGKQVADVELLAQELLSLPKADANSRAAALIKRWNFPNTYTLGKHMSEQLVARYQAKQQLPVAIVRPSLVSAIAGEPYPGYVGNWAGPIGATAAMAVGLFDCLESVASQPLRVWDVVPCDLVASSILAAAAAVSAGAAAAISRTTKAGSILGTPEDIAVVLGRPHPLTAQPQLHHQQAHIRGVGAATGAVTGCNLKISPGTAAVGLHATVKLCSTNGDHNSTDSTPSSTAAAAAAAARKAMYSKLRQQPCSNNADSTTSTSSTISTNSDDTAYLECSHSNPNLVALAECSSLSTQGDSCSGSSIGSPSARDSCRLDAAAAALRCRPGSVQIMQHLLDCMHGHHGGDDCSEDSLPSDMLLGASEGSSEAQHKQPALLIVHAATSSTYPVTLMECWNAGLEFLDTHEPPFRITTAPIPKMPADFMPSDDDVLACRRRIGWKVWALCKLLKLFGREKEAKKLQVGFETFCVHNNSKTDKDLVFSTHALVALEATLIPAEAADYLLVWQPVTNRSQTSSNSSGSKDVLTGAAGAGQCHHGRLASIVEAASDDSSLPSCDICSECGISAAVPAASTSAAAPTAGRGEFALAPISGNIVWRRYFHTQMASVFRTLYGVKVMRRKMMASAVQRVCEQGAQLTDADYIEHDFVAIR